MLRVELPTELPTQVVNLLHLSLNLTHLVNVNPDASHFAHVCVG
jgi:hypothetical protein